MFFNLSKILIFFTDPLFYIMLLSLIGVSRFKRKLLFLLIFFICYIPTTSIVSKRLLFFLEHLEEPTVSTNTMPYEAVIVLTGMVNLDNSSLNQIEFSEAVDRILTGIEWVLNNKANYLVISGGSGSLFNNQNSESVLLGQFAQKLGVPENKIILDTTSKNTFQNAVNTSVLLNEKHLERVVLVTSAFHMYRANGCFKRAGIDADLLPVDYNASLATTDFRDFLPSTSALSESFLFLHESIGILVYWITGKAELL